MNTHYSEQIPLYITGQLNEQERIEVETHLKQCSICRAELEFWRDLSDEIISSDSALTAPENLADKTLRRLQAKRTVKDNLLRALNLLRAQAYLVKREMWPASAAMMFLGVIMVLISKQIGVLTFLAPLIAAGCLAAIYGPQNDPASELTLATPTSPWKVLLARLTLVSSYNLLLSFIASLVLLTIIPLDVLGMVILAWLGPLVFLSGLALLLSLWIGTSNAITLTYSLWIIQYIHPLRQTDNLPVLQIWDNFLTSYRQFWQSPILLLFLALLTIVTALLLAQRSERILTQRLA